MLSRGSPNKRRRLEGDSEVCIVYYDMCRKIDASFRLPQQLYAQLDLDDLHASDPNNGIVLEMKDRDRYFDGRASVAGQQSGDEPVSKVNHHSKNGPVIPSRGRHLEPYYLKYELRWMTGVRRFLQ